jgi:hypothetical protein
VLWLHRIEGALARPPQHSEKNFSRDGLGTKWGTENPATARVQAEVTDAPDVGGTLAPVVPQWRRVALLLRFGASDRLAKASGFGAFGHGLGTPRRFPTLPPLRRLLDVSFWHRHHGYSQTRPLRRFRDPLSRSGQCRRRCSLGLS